MKDCPYCHGVSRFCFKVFSRSYHRCSKCGLIHKYSKETYEDVVANYRDNYFTRYSGDQTEGKRARIYEQILDVIGKVQKAGKILDVGTGCGGFLVAARERGWKVKGIDPSRESLDVARNQNNLDVFEGTLKEYKSDKRFDAITFINVLDHSAEPWKEIDLAKQLLAPNGVIFVRCPNGLLHTAIYRAAAKLGWEKYASKVLVFHEFCFTPMCVRKLFADGGFDDIVLSNSRPSETNLNISFGFPLSAKVVKSALYFGAKIIEILSYRRALIGTSFEVIARN